MATTCGRCCAAATAIRRSPRRSGTSGRAATTATPSGLEHCETPYLVTVPCDTPDFPEDLVARLADALEAQDAEIAMAATRSADGIQIQPVFCLMKSSLMESLVRFTESGQRKIDKWTAQHRCVEVVFDDAAAFFNANTPQELQQLQQRHGR